MEVAIWRRERGMESSLKCEPFHPIARNDKASKARFITIYLSSIYSKKARPLMLKSTLRRARFEALLFTSNRIISRIPSHTFRKWFYRHFMIFKIGENSYIFMDAWFDSRRSFSIGSNSVINQKCRMDNRGGIDIGNNVSISAEVCVLTADHDINNPTFDGHVSPVRIEDYAFVGTRAMILRGVTIGRGAVVAAGAIVTRDVPSFGIVAGSPAKIIGTRNRELNYTINYDRWLF